MNDGINAFTISLLTLQGSMGYPQYFCSTLGAPGLGPHAKSTLVVSSVHKKMHGVLKKTRVPRQNVQGTCSFFLTLAQTSDPECHFLSNTPVLAHTFEYNPAPILSPNSDNDK